MLIAVLGGVGVAVHEATALRPAAADAHGVVGYDTPMLLGWHVLGRSGRRGRLLPAASLGPVPLFLIGHDWGRWTALITLNLLVAALWLCGEDHERRLATIGLATRVALVSAAVDRRPAPAREPDAGSHADWYWELAPW